MDWWGWFVIEIVGLLVLIWFFKSTPRDEDENDDDKWHYDK